MDFRTLVDLPLKQLSINHSHRIMTIGSCFADNIGKKLIENKFQCIVNPFGVLYNPYSIMNILWKLEKDEFDTEDDLFFHNGLWHSYWHHGSFSNASKEICLAGINDKLRQIKEELKTMDYVIVTLGTSVVYEHKEKHIIVGNCHKLPKNHFGKYIPNSENISVKISLIADSFTSCLGSAKVIFTVSPIRHLSDGALTNHISKSLLMKPFTEDFFLSFYRGKVFYFPAYEIMMDELRDYRYYAEDMIHPSSLAIDYIWECFGKSYFDKDTKMLVKEYDEIRKALNHKPFHAESEEYKSFLRQIVLKIERIKGKCPYLDVQKELELCHILLSQ